MANKNILLMKQYEIPLPTQEIVRNGDYSLGSYGMGVVKCVDEDKIWLNLEEFGCIGFPYAKFEDRSDKSIFLRDVGERLEVVAAGKGFVRGKNLFDERSIRQCVEEAEERGARGCVF